MARSKKRQDGLYQRCLTIGRKANGDPDRKVIYAHTQKELEAKVAEYRDKLAHGMLPVYENVTFGEMPISCAMSTSLQYRRVYVSNTFQSARIIWQS